MTSILKVLYKPIKSNRNFINVSGEASRICSCEGRVFAAEEEPDVYRIWMPDDDCPGLAMSRAFGDFCLKDYGLIATPDVFYRKITKQDEFVVLASDGVSIIRISTFNP